MTWHNAQHMPASIRTEKGNGPSSVYIWRLTLAYNVTAEYPASDWHSNIWHTDWYSVHTYCQTFSKDTKFQTCEEQTSSQSSESQRWVEQLTVCCCLSWKLSLPNLFLNFSNNPNYLPLGLSRWTPSNSLPQAPSARNASGSHDAGSQWENGFRMFLRLYPQIDLCYF